MGGIALIWLRRDLRVADQPALEAALAAGLTPVPLYIHDEPTSHWPLGAASAWWLHHSLCALDRELQALGTHLRIQSGSSETVLLQTSKALGASHVFWNRLYEPLAVARDQGIKQRLREAGLRVESFNAGLLREPWELRKADGDPYRVFTPFWKALLKSGPIRPATAAPQTLPPGPTLEGPSVEELQLLPQIPWYRGFQATWTPGEAGAHAALQALLEERLLEYPEDRDRPDLPGTSRLSPHLHFGEISPQQIWHAVGQWSDRHTGAGAVKAAEAYVRQLGWREFGHHLLFHFPGTPDAPLDPRFRGFPWRRAYDDDLGRWQRGETGIPIVDAGMRELWHSGWMHNRVRMICASLLTKNLLIPWSEGAAWFWDTLVDADLANNTLGWQWTAGCGADAAPYFRVFNPVRQGERFDPDGSYVRRWVPELKTMPAEWIHQPWAAPRVVLEAAGVEPGADYPSPIVDLRESRERVLEKWEWVKRQER